MNDCKTFAFFAGDAVAEKQTVTDYLFRDYVRDTDMLKSSRLQVLVGFY
jgi:hypothetical protein